MVARRRHQSKIQAVREHYQRDFPAEKTFFQNDLLRGFAARRGPACRLSRQRPRPVSRDDDAFAGRQAVGLYHDRRIRGRRIPRFQASLQRSAGDEAVLYLAVGMPCRAIKSLANALLASSSAAFRLAPTIRSPRDSNSSVIPSGSGSPPRQKSDRSHSLRQTGPGPGYRRV